MLEQIKDVEHCLPFPVLGFDCDNGSEFLNRHLLWHFTEKKVRFARNRAYHKDDNVHIEQENWSHVRQCIDRKIYLTPSCQQGQTHLEVRFGNKLLAAGRVCSLCRGNMDTEDKSFFAINGNMGLISVVRLLALPYPGGIRVIRLSNDEISCLLLFS